MVVAEAVLSDVEVSAQDDHLVSTLYQQWKSGIYAPSSIQAEDLFVSVITVGWRWNCLHQLHERQPG